MRTALRAALLDILTQWQHGLASRTYLRTEWVRRGWPVRDAKRCGCGEGRPRVIRQRADLVAAYRPLLFPSFSSPPSLSSICPLQLVRLSAPQKWCWILPGSSDIPHCTCTVLPGQQSSLTQDVLTSCVKVSGVWIHNSQDGMHSCIHVC